MSNILNRATVGGLTNFFACVREMDQVLDRVGVGNGMKQFSNGLGRVANHSVSKHLSISLNEGVVSPFAFG